MEDVIAQRLRVFMDYLRSRGRIYNDADFCKKIGKNRAMVSEYLHGKRPITPAFATSVSNVFSELNVSWLLDVNSHEMLAKIENDEVPFEYATDDGTPNLPPRKFKNLDGLALIPQEDIISIMNQLSEISKKLESIQKDMIDKNEIISNLTKTNNSLINQFIAKKD